MRVSIAALAIVSTLMGCTPQSDTIIAIGGQRFTVPVNRLIDNGLIRLNDPKPVSGFSFYLTKEQNSHAISIQDQTVEQLQELKSLRNSVYYNAWHQIEEYAESDVVSDGRLFEVKDRRWPRQSTVYNINPATNEYPSRGRPDDFWVAGCSDLSHEVICLTRTEHRGLKISFYMDRDELERREVIIEDVKRLLDVWEI